MNRSHQLISGLFLSTFLAATPMVAAQQTAPAVAEEDAVTTTEPAVVETPPTIDLVICLDTSNSMDGLINAARTKIWQIVNDLALAEPTPRLRIALLDYGNDSLDPETGWVRVDSPFTEDLDLISQQLFGLTTNGGTEYVGRVLNRSLETLDWTDSEDALKLIVVSGNEGANQDPDYDFQEVCRTLISKGIMVNAIYCGALADNDAPGWNQIAKLTDGQFASIDPNYEAVAIATPYDQQMADLSLKVNTTYLAFGAGGREAWVNQAEQDSNAAAASPQASASRAQTKAGALYFCDWDLCDAIGRGDVDLATIEKALLPEVMQEMTLEEQKAYIEGKQAERAAIQEELLELGRKRDAFITKARQEEAVEDDQAFDVAVRNAIRSQAQEKGFAFPQADESDEQPAEESADASVESQEENPSTS